MKRTRIDSGEIEGFKRERIALDAGERFPAAGTTKHEWCGPGTLVRTTHPDGAREDLGETARVVTR